MRALLAVVLLATPCRAEPWIDYALLFQQNADKVVVSTDASGAETRQLDLGDGVTVTCTDQGCVGMDMNGAVGCAWAIYSELLAVAEVCGMPTEKTAGMTEFQRLQTAFIARNAVPPRSVAEIQAFHQSVVDRFRAEVAKNPLTCEETLAPDADVRMMIDGISSQVVDLEAAAKTMETPRLPVMNPCL
jgi:hypothetical protein